MCVASQQDQPVFLAHKLSGSGSINIETPAYVKQQEKFLFHAADLINTPQTPASQDVHRGSTSDIKNLKSTPPRNHKLVRQALGLSVEASKASIDKLCGPLNFDFWEARLEESRSGFMLMTSLPFPPYPRS